MKVVRSIKPEFEDARGSIAKILDDGKNRIRSVLLITSKAGSIRANHYHKKDTHFCYMLLGKMKYFERPVSGGKLTSVTLKQGDMVFTPAMHMHAMKFLEDSVFLALATRSRHQRAYENDTVRVKLI